MLTTPEQPRQISCVAAVICSTVCLAIVFFAIGGGIVGLMDGRTYTMGRGVHDLIVRQDTPGKFWFWIAAHFLSGIVGCIGAAIIFIFSFRRVQQ